MLKIGIDMCFSLIFPLFIVFMARFSDMAARSKMKWEPTATLSREKFY